MLVYIGFGAYALWETGLFRWTWWIIPGCWLLTYAISEIWKPKRKEIEAEIIPAHWTPQDEQATTIIKSYQQEVDKLSPEQLTDPQFYLSQAQRLAADLAKNYHPQAQDPYSSVSVLEVLAATRLAIEDLETWFQNSVPGSHLITIQQWKLLGQAPKWVRKVSNAGWAASILFNPFNIARYFTSRLTLGSVSEQLQSELLAAAYLRYIRLVGFYLIEMNSGRLRRGADRYRSTFGIVPDSDSTALSQTPPQAIQPDSVVITIVGQVKAGKSSLVNAIIGKNEATTDVLPATKRVSRHRLQIPGSDQSITLLDTPGYADSGATKAELSETATALAAADILILVSSATSPAKRADLDLLRHLRQQQEKQHSLKPCPIIICLTHIDLLSPVLEWSPPYDIENPTSAKEQSIAGSVAHANEVFCQLSIPPVAYIAVCTNQDKDRIYNVQEGLLPNIAIHLDEAKMVGLLKAYERELDRGKLTTLLKQLKNTGKSLADLWIQERLLKNSGNPESAESEHEGGPGR